MSLIPALCPQFALDGFDVMVGADIASTCQLNKCRRCRCRSHDIRSNLGYFAPPTPHTAAWKLYTISEDVLPLRRSVVLLRIRQLLCLLTNEKLIIVLHPFRNSFVVSYCDSEVGWLTDDCDA